MGLAAPGGFQARGFQITSVGGTLVAALQAAEIAKLDENRWLAALGIALSQASGVFEFLSNGASVKSMHPGWAAHAGMLAARLAAAGLDGPETALEGRMGLFNHLPPMVPSPSNNSRLCWRHSAGNGTSGRRPINSCPAATTCTPTWRRWINWVRCDPADILPSNAWWRLAPHRSFACRGHASRPL